MVREMFEVAVVPGWNGRPDLLAIEVVGNSFMKNMVRIMAGTLVDVGRGWLSAADVPGMLGEDADGPWPAKQLRRMGSRWSRSSSRASTAPAMPSIGRPRANLRGDVRT